MPEHRSRGRTRRGIAIALLAPAAVVAGIFTAAGLATASTSSPVAEPTGVPTLPSEIAPPSGATGASPTATGTHASPTRTRTGTATVPPVVPPPGATSATGTTGVTCLMPGATGTRSSGVVPGQPSATRTSPSATRTSPSRTGTAPPTGTAAPTGTAQPPSGVPVPQAMTGTTGTSKGASTLPTGPTTLKVGTAGGKADVIVDQNGCAVYLNNQDTAQHSNVQAVDETTWIPVMAPATVAGGLDQAKVGTFTRPDGKNQVTYNGHQLYRFAGDHAPGQANGQGVDGKYFLVGQNGNQVT
jgi:predicted lipoprotein with Yx(FWY)xxD motif